MGADRDARRCDIDWLRIGATLLLFPFHAALPFSHQPWHVKSATVADGFDVWVWFIHQFHMPLFFVLAGWSLERSLGQRTLRTVRRERVLRLLVPFLVGVVLLSPPQAYIEAITQRGFTARFPRFLTDFFTSLDWFSWHHLWFLIYLLTFTRLYLRSLASLPVLRGVKPWHLWAAIVPLTLVQVSLRWRWPGEQNLFDDWANFCWYSLFFGAGFLLARAPEAEPVIRRESRRAAVVFVLTALTMLPLLATLRERIVELGPGYFLYWPLSAIAAVSAIIALLGYAARLEHIGGTAFGYLREAALPLYVLHQPVIVVLGYWVVTANASIGVRYALLLATSTAVTMTVYHVLVRPSRVLGWAFGMRTARARRLRGGELPPAG